MTKPYFPYLSMPKSMKNCILILLHQHQLVQIYSCKSLTAAYVGWPNHLNTTNVLTSHVNNLLLFTENRAQTKNPCTSGLKWNSAIDFTSI